MTALKVSVELDDAPLRRGLSEVPRAAQQQLEAGMRSATEAVTQATARQTSAVADAARRQTDIRLASLREEEAALARLPERERAARQALLAEARQSAQQTLEAAERAFGGETTAAKSASQERIRLAREQAAVEVAAARGASAQRVVLLREEGAAARQAEATGAAAARRESAERVAAARAELAEFRTLRAQERGARQDRGALGGISASLAGQNLTQSVTRPIVGGLEDALKTTADFDTTLAVFRATSDATAGQMEKVRAKAIELGNDLTLPATSANDAAEAMAKLTQMGFSVDQSMTAAKGTLQLSAAAHISNADAARVEVDTLNQFGLAANQSSRVADILTMASLKSGKSIGQIADAFKYAGAEMTKAHVPIEEAGAAIAELGRHGVFGEQAGTNLRAMLIRLEAPTPRATARLHELGVSVFDASGRMKDMKVIIGDLHTAMEGMNDRTRMPIMSDIFGKQANLGANVLVKEGAEALDRMQAATTRQGAAAELAKAQMSGLNGAVEGFKSAVQTAELQTKPLADALARLINEDITPLVNKFAQLDTTTQEWVLGGVAALAAGGPLLSAVANATIIVNFLKGAFVATEAAEAATAAGGVSAFAAGGPYVLALAATAAAVYKIKTAWDDANKAQELHGRTDALDRHGAPSQAKAGDAKALRDEAADLQAQFEHRQDVQRGIVNIPFLGSKQLLPDAAGNALTGRDTALGAAYHASQDELMERIRFDLGRAKQIEDAAKNAGKSLGAGVKKNFDQGVADGLTQTPGQAVDALLGPAAGGGASDARGLAIEARIKAHDAAEKAQAAHHKRVEAEAKRFHEAMAAARGKLADLERGDKSPLEKVAAQFPDLSAARRRELVDIDNQIAKVREQQKALEESRKAHERYADALKKTYAEIRDARRGPKSHLDELKEQFPGASPSELAALDAARQSLDRIKQAHEANKQAVAAHTAEVKKFNEELAKETLLHRELLSGPLGNRSDSAATNPGFLRDAASHDLFNGKDFDKLTSPGNRRDAERLADQRQENAFLKIYNETAGAAAGKLHELTAASQADAIAWQRNGTALSGVEPRLRAVYEAQAALILQTEQQTFANQHLGDSFSGATPAAAGLAKQMNDMAADHRIQDATEELALQFQKARAYCVEEADALDYYHRHLNELTPDELAHVRALEAQRQAVEGLSAAYGGLTSEIDDVYGAQRRQLNLGGPPTTYTMAAGNPSFANVGVNGPAGLNFALGGYYGGGGMTAPPSSPSAGPATSPTVNIHLHGPNFADPRSANQQLQDIGHAVTTAVGRLGG